MEIKKRFDEVAHEYDSQRRMLIPCFDDFYGIAIENLELHKTHPRILDLGAGTGLFTQLVIEKYPSALMDLVDISDEMLAIAKQRFVGNESIRYFCEAFNTFKSKGTYDAIISSLAIHHVPDEEKITIYRKIYHWLKPGGVFINAEHTLGATPFLEDLYMSQWKRKVESSTLSEREIKNAYDRVKLDIRTPMQTQLNWLIEVGFKEADCLYKYYDFSVLWAQKSGPDIGETSNS